MKNAASPPRNAEDVRPALGQSIDRVRVTAGVADPLDRRNRGERGEGGHNHPEGSPLHRLEPFDSQKHAQNLQDAISVIESAAPRVTSMNTSFQARPVRCQMGQVDSLPRQVACHTGQVARVQRGDEAVVGPAHRCRVRVGFHRAREGFGVFRAQQHRAPFANHVRYRTPSDDPPLPNDGDMGAGALDFREQVARQEDRLAAVSKDVDDLTDLTDSLRVEPVGGFVEDDQFGIAQHGGRERQPLLHAERIGLEVVLRPVGQANQFQTLLDPWTPHSLDRCRDAKVVATAHVRVEVGCLQRGADAGAGGHEALGAGSSEQAEATARRLDGADEHPDGGRLAASVRTEEAEHLALFHGEGDPVHGQHRFSRARPVAFGQFKGLDCMHATKMVARLLRWTGWGSIVWWSARQTEGR